MLCAVFALQRVLNVYDRGGNLLQSTPLNTATTSLGDSGGRSCRDLQVQRDGHVL
jgi:hypothetical protein